MEYSIAAAIADRGIQLSSYAEEAVTRREIAPYLDRIVVREATDKMFPRWASISIAFKDGQVRTCRVDELRGSPHAPLSEEELFEKISDCLSWGNSTVRADDLLDAAKKLPTIAVRELMAAIERPAALAKQVQ